MSIQAVGWAIEQADVPPRPALVLMALANHANHVDGHCYPSIETIAREARCSRRAVFGYLAALERNGYVEIRRTRKKNGRQGVNNYWLIFDRLPLPWAHLGPVQDDPEPPIAPEDAETLEEIEQEIAAVDNSRVQDVHPGDSVENSTENPPPECKAYAPSQSAPVCTRHIMPEPSDSITVKDSPSGESRARAPLVVGIPNGYRPQARTEQAASLQAAEEARKPKKIPVIEGSRPWKAWIEHGHPRTLVGMIDIDGRRDRGWYFDTLYPPKSPKQSTGPPELSFMSPEDHDHI